MLRPKPYSNTDSAESDAITVLYALVDRRNVKLDIPRGDKIPNTDGTAELVDEGGVPLGKVAVQVRKIPTGRLWYACETELFAYSKITTLPVLLVCVDVEEKKAFWKHVYTGRPDFKPEQKTSRLKFDPVVDAVGPDTPYITGWQAVVADYQARIAECPTLKKRLDEEVGLASIPKPGIIYFQTFIQTINQLLDIDFPPVKQQFFANIWKLGVGIHGTKPERIFFQIYSIQKGENAPLVSSFVDKPLEGFLFPAAPNVVSAWSSGRGSTVQRKWVDRALLKDAETEGRNFIVNYVKKMVEQRLFQVAGKLLAKEYLFGFLERYHHCAGLPLADSYDVASINYALRVYMPAWCFLAQRRHYEVNKDLIPPGVFPSFENAAGMWPADEQPKPEQVQELLKSGRRIPPTFVSTQLFSLRALAQSLDYLLATGEQTVERVYRKRTSRPAWLWDGYTTEDVRFNVTTILTNAIHEYGLFVRSNSLNRLKSQYLDENMAMVYVGDVSAWKGRDQVPQLECYLVENHDRRLSKITFVEKSSVSIPFQANWERLTVGRSSEKWFGEAERLRPTCFRIFPR